MKLVLAAALLALVAGCGGSSSDSKPKAAATTTPPAAATMAETCPKVMPLLPDDDLSATRRDWTDLRSKLSPLYIAGDAEVKAVLEQVDRAAALYEQGPAQGEQAGEAFGDWTAARQALKDHGC